MASADSNFIGWDLNCAGSACKVRDFGACFWSAIRIRIHAVARQLRDAKIQAWMTAKERALLDLLADQEGMTRSDLVRKILCKGMTAMLTEKEDINGH